MKKIALILFTFLLLSKDAGTIYRAGPYDAVAHLHIAYEEILSLQERRYDVYVYSEGCQHCQSIRAKMIVRALDRSLINLYFIPISADMSFGPSNEKPICCLCSLRIPGYPFVMRIDEGCLIERWLGASVIMETYLLDVPKAGH